MRIPSPDSVTGYKHGDAGVRFAFSMGRYMCCFGSEGTFWLLWRVPSFLRVFTPECHRINRPFVLSPSNPFSSLSASVPALKTRSTTNARKLLRHLKGILTKTVICDIYIYCVHTYKNTLVCLHVCVCALCFFQYYLYFSLWNGDDKKTFIR